MRIAAASLVVAAIVAPILAHADDDGSIPPGTPPDIAAIMKKMNSGQQPTPEEMQKLYNWIQGVAAHAGLPVGTPESNGAPAPTPEGIPLRYTVTMSWSESYDKGTGKGSGSWTGSGEGLLFPTVGGNADYNQNVMNTSVGVSVFRLQPTIGAGSGTWTCHNVHGDTRIESHGKWDSFLLSAELFSTGGANLYANESGIGGAYSGTVETTDLHTGDVNTETTTDNRGAPCGPSSPWLQESRLDVQLKPGEKIPAPKMAIGYDAMVKAVSAAGQSELSGAETDDWTDDKGFAHDQASATLKIVLRPKKLDLIVEPGDRDAYEKWLPMPDEKESGAPELFGKPARFKVHAALHDEAKGPIVEAAGRTRPDADRGDRIDLYLDGVSRNKGVAMNFPASGKGDDKPDLFFPQDGQPQGIQWDDESHVHTISNSAVEATAVVAARDTGAYGSVRARCTTLGLESKSWEGDDFLLPRDKNGNHIADGWEKDEGIFEKNLPPDWDDEDRPGGMATRGDGLTLFEEYRGFVVEIDDAGHEKHRRLAPTGKKLFVHAHGPKDAPLEKEGARRYGAATGIEPIFVHDPSRMALAGDATIPHWVNFQESPFAHAQTFALWIEDHGGDNPGFAEGLDDFPDLYRHSPGNTRMLNVSRFACDSVVSSMTKWLSLVPLPETVQTGLAKLGLDASTVGRSALANHEQLVREMIVFVTMHEMGHATGGRHHHVEDVVRGQIDNEGDPFFPDDLEQATYSSGDHSCPMRYWHFGSDKTDTLLFLAGRWDPSASAPGGGAWKFCADDWPQMSLKP